MRIRAGRARPSIPYSQLFPCPTYTDTRPTQARGRKHSYEYEDIPLIRSTYRSCGYDSRKAGEGSQGGAGDDDEQGRRDSDRRREGMLNPKRKRKRGEDAGASSRFLIASSRTAQSSLAIPPLPPTRLASLLVQFAPHSRPLTSRPNSCSLPHERTYLGFVHLVPPPVLLLPLAAPARPPRLAALYFSSP